MAEKTIQGKPCPKCFSFVSSGTEKCGVCGFNLQGKTDQTIPEYKIPDSTKSGILSKVKNKKVIICSKCATENHHDFRFCKICKHPLQDDQELTARIDELNEKEVQNKKKINMSLYLDWVKKPAEYKIDETLIFMDFLPYFNGYLTWQEYIFLTYQKSDQNEILIRKINKSTFSHFYKKCTHITIVDSGKVFYLGTIKFQLLGDQKEKEDVKTVIKSNKTIVKGPGESKKKLLLKGRPRLKLLNTETTTQYLEIEGKSNIGRDEIANFFKISDEELRKKGLSRNHITITPIYGGKWLMEPSADKPFYEEINEIPLLLTEGDIIRWVLNDQFGEFRIKVKSKEN